ncbi:hypothetical protein JD844_029110 [Phrynosoma platyrhinos]|uniref:Inositol oxygenase n=1 Tax=Phrynosoma platyrhinos TaxID=52577 RepID=A0ABQ7SIU4_PHRPL|nr:hypothetical protein JD844_029110 [Phrynosoma platyrhinos]
MERVYNTYLQMHTNQTVEFVRKKHEEYGGCRLRQMTVMEALDLLDNVVDESDPDVDFPNSYHAYQTAEGIRRAHPDKEYMYKVMKYNKFILPQEVSQSALPCEEITGIMSSSNLPWFSSPTYH